MEEEKIRKENKKTKFIFRIFVALFIFVLNIKSIDVYASEDKVWKEDEQYIDNSQSDVIASDENASNKNASDDNAFNENADTEITGDEAVIPENVLEVNTNKDAEITDVTEVTESTEVTELAGTNEAADLNGSINEEVSKEAVVNVNTPSDNTVSVTTVQENGEAPKQQETTGNEITTEQANTTETTTEQANTTEITTEQANTTDYEVADNVIMVQVAGTDENVSFVNMVNVEQYKIVNSKAKTETKEHGRDPLREGVGYVLEKLTGSPNESEHTKEMRDLTADIVSDTIGIISEPVEIANFTVETVTRIYDLITDPNTKPKDVFKDLGKTAYTLVPYHRTIENAGKKFFKVIGISWPF